MRIFGLSAIGAAIVASLALTVSSGADAQVIVGGQSKPTVEIDNSVLDRLGPEPVLADLYLNRQPKQTQSVDAPVSKKVVLKRPSSSKMTVTLRNPNRTAKPAAPKDTKLASATAPAKPVASTAPAKAPEPQIASAEPAKPAPSEKAAEPAVEQKPADKPVEAKPAQPEPAKETAKAPEPVKPADPAPVPPAPQASAPAAQAPVSIAPPPPAPVEAPAAKAPEAQTPPPPAQAQAPQTPPAPAVSAAPPPRAVNPPPPPAPPTLTLGAPPPMPPVSVPAPPAQEARLAPPPSAPRNAAPLPDGSLTVGFETDGAALNQDARTLLTSLAQKLNTDGDLTVMLMAYASGNDDTASRARHLSLSRALAIRSFLIDQGVRSTRIEVRALGNKVPDGPADRVDMIVQKR